ncbi:MAG: ABC transporter permease [Pseudonocardiales bacterium]|nr:ABC transporter permease [Pseudonocardiales bacterium]
MTLTETFLVAIRSLRANRLRSVLTILGIMIGVASVIVLVAIGNGTSAKLNDQIESLGTNLVGVFQSRGNVAQNGRSQALTDKDVRAIQSSGVPPRLLTVTPVKQGSAVLQTGTTQWRTSIAGSSPDYLAALHRSISAGRFFSDAEVRTSSRVVVLGSEPIKKLYNDNPAAALGQKIRIGKQSFEVVGTLEKNGQADDIAAMPITAARNYLVGGGADQNVDQIVVQATSQDAVTATMAKVTRVLLEEHHITNPDQKDFEVRSNLELLTQFTKQSSIFTIFLTIIAAISLLVGGIGIMNIMLVTVTERTREIGIRKAIGARRRAILKQFLIESTVLAGLGGAVGVAFGVAIAMVGGALDPAILGDFPPPKLSLPPVLIAFVVSLAVGLFFGAYPANRASSLRPIDALRYE